MNIRLIIISISILFSCSSEVISLKVPNADFDNGGLILPGGFGACATLRGESVQHRCTNQATDRPLTTKARWSLAQPNDTLSTAPRIMTERSVFH